MSKSSLISGLVLSAIIHAVFLLPAWARRNTSVAGQPVPTPPVIVVPPDPAPPIPPPKQVENEPEIDPPPPPEPVAEQVEMAEVVSPPTPEVDEAPGETARDMLHHQDGNGKLSGNRTQQPKQRLRAPGRCGNCHYAPLPIIGDSNRGRPGRNRAGFLVPPGHDLYLSHCFHGFDEFFGILLKIGILGPQRLGENR